MSSYDVLRQRYRPGHIRFLLVAESPPPAAEISSSRHFYRSEMVQIDDRLFTNTMRALYPEAIGLSEGELEKAKEQWLRRFQADGWYMIEALEASLQHHVTKPQRQARIKDHLDRLIKRVKKLAMVDTKIILVKSNVFEVAAEPLRRAGFSVLNSELLDYPGHFNQRAYREKLTAMVVAANKK